MRQQGGKQNYPHLGLDTITLKPSGGGLGKKREGSQGEKGYVEGKKSIWKTDSKHQSNDFTLKSRAPSLVCEQPISRLCLGGEGVETKAAKQKA